MGGGEAADAGVFVEGVGEVAGGDSVGGGGTAVRGGIVLVAVGAGACGEGDAGACHLAGGIVGVGFLLAVAGDIFAATVVSELVGGGFGDPGVGDACEAGCVVVGACGGE